MTPEQFLQFGEAGYNHVPVVRQIFADLDTPLSCYVKVATGAYSYLLESAAQGGEKWARYSVVGLPCPYVIKVYGHELVIEEAGTKTESLYVADRLPILKIFRSSLSILKLSACPSIPVAWWDILAMTQCVTLNQNSPFNAAGLAQHTRYSAHGVQRYYCV